MILSESCNCPCHNGKKIKHSIPCCTICHICGKRIRQDLWMAHMRKCDPKFSERNKKIKKKIKEIKHNPWIIKNTNTERRYNE